MMDIFGLPGRFYRGNLHTHSTNSDGVLPPQEVCRRYRAEGYDFICLSDHFVGLYDYPISDTTAYRDDGFTTILGAEVHAGAMENGEVWHILAVGLPPNFAPPHSPDFGPVDGQESGPALAQRCRDAGAFVAVAHPEWSGLTLADAQSIDAAHAVEVYNHACCLGYDRGGGFWHLDRLSEGGCRLNMIATDDAHFTGSDHFGGWVMVKADKATPEALLTALKAGHYYSSQGPQFYNVTWSADTVVVETSDVTSVIVQGRGSAAFGVHGEAMTHTEVSLAEFAGCDWLRVTIVDAAGKRAWLNPHWR